MSDQQPQQQTPPSPMEALQFLDGILAGVAGSRKDHVAIQGALGIVGQALQPKPEASELPSGEETPDITPPAADEAPEA